ncbi:MAG: BMC domain-containing protein [Planctomycetota bacterium]
MFRGAIGIIETIGQVGSIEAADAMAKCADVELLGREDIGGGYHAVCVRGDVGSVRASIEAGVRAAERVGRIVGALLIPRPHDDLGMILDGSGLDNFGSGPVVAVKPEELSEMNVHQLRATARSLPNFPLKGREISRANREQLLAALREVFAETSNADDATTEDS